MTLLSTPVISLRMAVMCARYMSTGLMSGKQLGSLSMTGRCWNCLARLSNEASAAMVKACGSGGACGGGVGDVCRLRWRGSKLAIRGGAATKRKEDGAAGARRSEEEKREDGRAKAFIKPESNGLEACELRYYGIKRESDCETKKTDYHCAYLVSGM